MVDVKKQNVLCVDDDKRNLQLLEALLLPEGYELRFSGSGEDALFQIRERLPDLILLDVMMPNMSGLEVLQRLRADERTRLIPVVFLTALNAKEERITGIDAGCDDFISKPFDAIELLVRVRSLLKSSYYRRSLDEKDKFESVIQGLREGVIVCDPDWRVTRVNRSAKRFLELTEGDLFLRHVFERYVVSISRESLADLSGSHETFDIERQATDEFKALHLEAQLDILRGPGGEPSSLVLTIRDVTRQRNENFLALDFLSLLSHKFNTPVTVIGETLDLIRQGIGKREDLALIDAAEKRLKEIHDLSQRIIYVLEMQSKGMRDVFEEGFLSNAVYTAKERLDAKYKIVGILEKEIPVRKVALWKVIVFEELMENAYKFHGKDGLRMKLTLTEEAMTFSDNGVGIPPEEQEKIFEPFYQVYKDFHGNIPGLGLGLTLVKRLVELNQGKIEVESGFHQGTQIKILFGSPQKS